MTSDYNPKETPWKIKEEDYPSEGSRLHQFQYLIRYAILAPSSHNTQPWKFQLENRAIRLFSDKSRWLKVADPDKREFYLSQGCALENLIIAAEHFGFEVQVEYFPQGEDDDQVALLLLDPDLQNTSFRDPALFNAIPYRQTNHHPYEPRVPPKEHLDQLRNCCAEEGIYLHLTTDHGLKKKVSELIKKADAIQFANPDYREELGYWIGQGVFGTSWLVSKIGQFAVNYLDITEKQVEEDTRVLMSAPVLAALSSEKNDRTTQVQVGQAFERLMLTATKLGMAIHPMSQALEIYRLKEELNDLTPTPEAYLQHTFRLGYAKPEGDHTPRRELEEFLV